MARVSTYRSRGKMPIGVPDVSVSPHIGALTAGQRAKSRFADVVGLISAAEGRRIQLADQKAQNIAGEAAIKSRMLELFDSFDTNPNEDDYQPAYEKTVKSLDEIVKNTTNANSKRDLQQFIQTNKPSWDASLNDAVLSRKRTNTLARRDLSVSEIDDMDLSDPLELDEAELRVGKGGDLMRELGYSQEQIEGWMDAALKKIENQSIYNQAQRISQVQGYQAAIKWVMAQNIDTDAKRDIVGDIKFEAAQRQMEYDIEVERIEQDFLEKLRKEQLTENEIMASPLEVDKKQEWLRLIDAQAKERLEGEVELNPEAYDRLQGMVEDYDNDKISKDEVRKALSEAAGKDIPMTVYRSLRDRLATKDKPDDPMNRASVKRAMGILAEMKNADFFWPKGIDEDEIEGKRQNLLKYLELTRELEQWITANPDVKDKEINQKIDQMTTTVIEERGFFDLWWEDTKKSMRGGIWAEGEAHRRKRLEKEGEDLSKLTDEELEAIIRGK